MKGGLILSNLLYSRKYFKMFQLLWIAYTWKMWFTVIGSFFQGKKYFPEDF